MTWWSLSLDLSTQSEFSLSWWCRWMRDFNLSKPHDHQARLSCNGVGSHSVRIDPYTAGTGFLTGARVAFDAGGWGLVRVGAGWCGLVRVTPGLNPSWYRSSLPRCHSQFILTITSSSRIVSSSPWRRSSCPPSMSLLSHPHDHVLFSYRVTIPMVVCVVWWVILIPRPGGTILRFFVSGWPGRRSMLT
jgi:hypothetical protein